MKREKEEGVGEEKEKGKEEKKRKKETQKHGFCGSMHLATNLCIRIVICLNSLGNRKIMMF